MKRVWGQVLAGLSVVAGGAAAFPACVHNDSTIFIRDVLAPQFAHAGMLCVFTPDPMQTFTWSGVLDMSLRLDYNAVYLVGNQMLPQVNSTQLQTETSTVTIRGAIVRITNADGQELDRYTRLTSATIAPSSGSTPGYAPVAVTIINALALSRSKSAQDLAASPMGPGYARLVTYVRFFGQTLGGQSVESNEFEFPVDVCNGCLIGFTNNPNYPFPNCVGNPGAIATVTSTQTQIPCEIGQDLAIDCNVCQDFSGCHGAYQGTPPTDAGSAPDTGSDASDAGGGIPDAGGG